MSHGASAITVAVVEQSDLEKLNLSTYQTLINLLEEGQYELKNLANETKNDEEGLKYFGELGDIEFQIATAYKRFTQQFYIKYNIIIELDYHDNDRFGSPYDNVEGAFFKIDFHKIYGKTPFAYELEKKVPFDIQSYTHED